MRFGRCRTQGERNECGSLDCQCLRTGLCRAFTGTEADELVGAGAGMFLQPAVQYVGVHGVGSGQSCDGCAGFLAGSHQIGLELRCVGAVGAPIWAYLGLGVFEHSVHDWLSGHDLVRSKA